MQGLPEGHTEACYPVLRPGVDSHRAPPLKDSDADKREVCLNLLLLLLLQFNVILKPSRNSLARTHDICKHLSQIKQVHSLCK